DDQYSIGFSGADLLQQRIEDELVRLDHDTAREIGAVRRQDTFDELRRLIFVTVALEHGEDTSGSVTDRSETPHHHHRGTGCDMEGMGEACGRTEGVGFRADIEEGYMKLSGDGG